MPNAVSEHHLLPADFAGLQLTNTYTQLPQRFYSYVKPTKVSAPSLIAINESLADELNLDSAALASREGVAMLAGNALPSGSQPIAQVYAGHQFGHFNPQLGDGRAILLGDLLDRQGQRRDLQLKGPGPTPYSRSGDGRAAMGPVIREFLVSEAMHNLGITTTRALAAVTTGDWVYRQTAQPGAVLTRVAASHVRIGTFEYFARRGDTEAVRQLADFVIARHGLSVGADTEPSATYLALLDQVIARQARLIAQWLQVGFIHGVMNTDNMAIGGETIDYGPCAFMEAYDPTTVFSSIDHAGRYAYGNQGSIALWNLTRFAECLLPLLHDNQDQAVNLAQDALGQFSTQFNQYWRQGMGRKLGLSPATESDQPLIRDYLQLLQDHGVDFTLGFRLLSSTLLEGDAGSNLTAQSQPWSKLFNTTANVDSAIHPAHVWHAQWRQRLMQEKGEIAAISTRMNAVNPLYIPRNHQVENVLSAAIDHQDFGPMQRLMQVLRNPFTEQLGMDDYAQPAPAGGPSYQTFCGT
jgi:serine/tyrosine/threonine adenylyltransferase